MFNYSYMSGRVRERGFGVRGCFSGRWKPLSMVKPSILGSIEISTTQLGSSDSSSGSEPLDSQSDFIR